jgi:dipeptidase E
MKKLLLTSNGFTNLNLGNKFLELVGKSAGKIKVLYIPTASNVEKDRSYTEINKQEIIRVGIKKENLVEFDLDKNPDYGLLRNIDSIFVEGGNTFYLLSRVRQTGFGKKILELVNAGVVYVGVSAGSILACKDIKVAEPFDRNDYIIKDFEGLGLTNKIIVPHFQRKDDKLIKDFETRTGYTITRLNDGQALLVTGDLEKIIE